ncbi:MAG: hypothetical protein O7B24_14395 [Alphaproteobacteria bacterium]|nr:hypothetical protein [Alphaproteobacteria bacterium]
MIKSLTRASLLALFSTSIFAAAAIAPPPASADWLGEIAPAAEQPAGQAQASGFADENGLISIPTPAQVGDTEEAVFRGSGAVKIAVSDGTMLIVEETPPLTGLQLSIRTGRGSNYPFHAISFTRVDRTGAVVENFSTFMAHYTDGVSASVEMTGSFVCSGTICDGPQDGKLSFRLKVLAPPE